MIDDVTVYSLSNTVTKEQVNVLSFGGKIDSLRLGPNSEEPPRDVLASRCSPDLRDCTSADLKSQTSVNAMLIPYANRVYEGQYEFPQRQINYLSDDNTTTSHGFLYDGRELSLVGLSSDSERAHLTLSTFFNGSDPGYPFQVETNITYTLDTEGFSLSVVSQNVMFDSQTSVPFMVGSHPYFHLRKSNFSNAIVELDQRYRWNRVLQRSDAQVPNGKALDWTAYMDGSKSLEEAREFDCPLCDSIWDDGFKRLGRGIDDTKITIHDGDDEIVLTMSPEFNFVQIYTGNDECGIAVEPMSGSTDNWNNRDGTDILEVGKAAGTSRYKTKINY